MPPLPSSNPIVPPPLSNCLNSKEHVWHDPFSFQYANPNQTLTTTTTKTAGLLSSGGGGGVVGGMWLLLLPLLWWFWLLWWWVLGIHSHFFSAIVGRKRGTVSDSWNEGVYARARKKYYAAPSWMPMLWPPLAPSSRKARIKQKISNFTYS